MSDALKLAFIVALWLTVNTLDYHVAVETAPIRMPRVSFLDAPDCPKVNAAGQELRSQVAMQADGGDWTYSCGYE